MTIVRLHSLRPAPPWRYDALRERFARIRNHQLWVANQLRAKPMAGGTCAEMAVKREMPWCEFVQSEPGLCVAVIGRITEFFPFARRSEGGLESWSGGFFITPFLHHSIAGSLSQDGDTVPAPFERSFN